MALKVLLVNPPVLHDVSDNTPRIIEEGRGCLPPLGILYVAAHLEAHSDYTVEVVDGQIEPDGLREVENRIRVYRPDVVGVTALTMALLDVMAVIECAKRVDPNIRVVVGGPHTYLFPEETGRLPGVDFVVCGEGEEVFGQLLERIDDVAALRQLPGLVFFDGDELVTTGRRPLIANIDTMPFPARNLVPSGTYSSLLAKRDPATTLITSRGCPYRCTFCDRPHLGKRFRAHSPRYVVGEMEACVKMGIHQFMIYDDTFTVDRQRVLDICAGIRRQRLDVGFDIRTRVDTVSEGMLTQLKAAGCEGIHYGIESGSERVLRELNKEIDLEHAQRIFDVTRKCGISRLAYFMIGNPKETLSDIQKTFALMKRLDPDYVHITVLTPFPGTRLHEDGLRRGLLKGDTWQSFAQDPKAGFRPPYWSEFFSREELDDLLVRGYRKFYLRPSYIARRIMRVRSLTDLKKKTSGALRVLTMKGTNSSPVKEHSTHTPAPVEIVA